MLARPGSVARDLSGDGNREDSGRCAQDNQEEAADSVVAVHGLQSLGVEGACALSALKLAGPRRHGQAAFGTVRETRYLTPVSRIVLITGASGFLGRHVCNELLRTGHAVRVLVRQGRALPGTDAVTWHSLEDVHAIESAVEGVSAVVHLAARVHVMSERHSDPIAEFQRVNVDATRRIASLAAAAGVVDFVFASSVKAAGESNSASWTERSVSAPTTPYGRSKLEAERALQAVSDRTGMRAVSLRFPLIYGAGVGGNMLRLFNAVDRGWPLPLRSIRNSRSLLYAGNAANAVGRVLEADSAGVYYVSDGEDISTADLVERIGRALGRHPRLFSIPTILIHAARYFGGRRVRDALDRLTGSLTIDSSALVAELGAALPYTLDDGLAATATWYRSDPSARV